MTKLNKKEAKIEIDNKLKFCPICNTLFEYGNRYDGQWYFVCANKHQWYIENGKQIVKDK